ncbi:hypothetical protein Leryth_022834 [Lithospermum erythrorhizon]|nr:hypothetical protein Leryth_022834 [Lithospermum erythrorhizon]
MITCRSLIGFGTFGRLSYTHVASKSPKLLNECSLCRRNLSYRFTVEKFSSLVMDKGRRKRVTSDQASSSFAEVVEAQGSNAEGDMRKKSISMEVSSSQMRFIKGKGGETQKKIEDELGVQLLFPSSREEDSIMINGNSAENVAAASDKVRSIIVEAVESPNLDYSHFVSLPLALHPELVDKLINFQNSILGKAELDQDDNLEGNSISMASFTFPYKFLFYCCVDVN